MNYAPGFAQINQIALSQAVQFIPSRFSARARLFLIEGMIRANWQDGLVPTTRDILHLKRGQFVMGLEEMSEVIEISVGKLKTTMKQLKKVGEIACKGTDDGTIVTIMNYETYTSAAGTDDTQDGKQATSTRQTGDNSKEEKEKQDNKERERVKTMSPRSSVTEAPHNGSESLQEVVRRRSEAVRRRNAQ